MKVKSLYPIIATDDIKKTIAFYETLGFKVIHDVTTKMNSHVYVLSNGEQEIEIMQALNKGPVNIPIGLYGLRMNVDDIETIYEELKQEGATIVAGPLTTASGNKSLLIKDSQGINITLVEHVKNNKGLNDEDLKRVAGGYSGVATAMGDLLNFLDDKSPEKIG